MAAVCLLAGAFLVASDRLRVLRRVGRWAVRLGLASLATGWLLPSLLSRAGNSRLAFVGALAVALGGRIVVPAVILVATGTAAIVAARMWRTAEPVAITPAPSAPPEACLPPVAAQGPESRTFLSVGAGGGQLCEGEGGAPSSSKKSWSG
jgi:hypothetical protein